MGGQNRLLRAGRIKAFDRPANRQTSRAPDTDYVPSSGHGCSAQAVPRRWESWRRMPTLSARIVDLDGWMRGPTTVKLFATSHVDPISDRCRGETATRRWHRRKHLPCSPRRIVCLHRRDITDPAPAPADDEEPATADGSREMLTRRTHWWPHLPGICCPVIGREPCWGTTNPTGHINVVADGTSGAGNAVVRQIG